MTRRTLLEVISALGVIAGLVFVGLEIRQAAVATRAATVLQLKQTWVELNLTLASSPEISRALVVWGEEPYATLDLDTRMRAAAFYRALFYSISNAHSQFVLGTLDYDEWLPHLRDIASLSAQANTWAFWEDWGHIYSDRFQGLMDSLRTANYDLSRTGRDAGTPP